MIKIINNKQWDTVCIEFAMTMKLMSYNYMLDFPTMHDIIFKLRTQILT